MSAGRQFDAVFELTKALADRTKPLLIKLDENDCIIAAHYDYGSEYTMGIVFRHEEGPIDIGVSAPEEIEDGGDSDWTESIDPRLSDGLPGLAIICHFTDVEASEIGLQKADAGGPASGGIPMVRFSGDLGALQAKLADKGLRYRFAFRPEIDANP